MAQGGNVPGRVQEGLYRNITRCCGRKYLPQHLVMLKKRYIKPAQPRIQPTGSQLRLRTRRRPQRRHHTAGVFGLVEKGGESHDNDMTPDGTGEETGLFILHIRGSLNTLVFRSYSRHRRKFIRALFDIGV